MAVNTVRYRSNVADATVHPSEAIWGGMPLEGLRSDRSLGYYFDEDFTSFAKTTAIGSNLGRYVGDAGGYVSWEDTSCTITPLVGVPTGAVRFAVTATGSKATVLEFGGSPALSGGEQGPFMYTDGSGPQIRFECRVRLGSITDSKQNTFIGLAQTGVAVVPAAATSTTTLFDSGTTVGQVNKIGFEILTGTGMGALILACYGKVSTTQNILGIVQTAADTSTWYKLGFILDPFTTMTSPLSGGGAVRRKGRFFVNGIEVAACGFGNTGAGTGNPSVLATDGTTATTVQAFPTAKQLTPAVHVETVTTTAINFDVDFMKCAQVNNS